MIYNIKEVILCFLLTLNILYTFYCDSTKEINYFFGILIQYDLRARFSKTLSVKLASVRGGEKIRGIFLNPPARK